MYFRESVKDCGLEKGGEVTMRGDKDDTWIDGLHPETENEDSDIWEVSSVCCLYNKAF